MDSFNRKIQNNKLSYNVFENAALIMNEDRIELKNAHKNMPIMLLMYYHNY